MKISSLSLAIIGAALLCGRATAAETDYDAGAKALPLQQAAGTARAAAMASAVVAVPQGSASLLWNPAALSRLNCMEAGLHHNTGLGDTVQETLIFGMPLGTAKSAGMKNCAAGSLGGIAASFGYVDHGTFDGMDALGVQTADYKAGDFSGSAGWGMELLPKFSGGITLKGNQSRFGHKSYNAFAADLGLLYTLLPSLDLGVTYSNINLGSKIGGSQLTSGWRLGAAWAADKHLLLAASSELQNNAMNRLQLGGEYLIGNTDGKTNILALRAGYQLNYPEPQLGGLTGLTLGLGYTFTRSLTLDYAMVPAGELGTSHRFSLTYKFDCRAKPQATASGREVILEDSHFDFDQSALRPEGMAALRENVQLLKENPKEVVRVAGYSSKRGTEEYNQKLSERRAAAVSEYLISQGIAANRITTVGYGELRPAKYEATSEKDTDAAKANKRVVFTVTVN